MINYDDFRDIEILERAGLLKTVPRRDPHREARGLVEFLAEARVARRSRDQFQIEALLKGLNTDRKPASRPGFRLGGLRLIQLGMTALLIAGMFLGGGLTAFAASASLPGDSLYPLKLTVESAQTRFSPNAQTDAELHLSLARRRVDEIASLTLKGRYEGIPATAQKFEYHRSMVLQSLNSLADQDPAKAREIAVSASITLGVSNDSLVRLRGQVPESAVSDLDPALAGGVEAGGGAAIKTIIEPASADSGGMVTPPDPGLDEGENPGVPPLPAGLQQTPADPPSAFSNPTLPASGPENLDLEIKKFKVTKKVKLEKEEAVELILEIKNTGAVEGSALATILGMQDGVEVYRIIVEVSDPAGNGHTVFSLPVFTPSATGQIEWTASLAAPGLAGEVAQATTMVDP